MHNPAYRCILTFSIVSVLLAFQVPRCAAQQDAPTSAGARGRPAAALNSITVALFGTYSGADWNTVSTGVMIGHIGDELHYVLTVLSPCRQKPIRLWVLREGENRLGGSQDLPENAREAWVISKNNETGLSLLVFHEKDTSSAYKPGLLSEVTLRAGADLRFHAIYVGQENPPAETSKVFFASTADGEGDLSLTFRALGALLDDNINVPASAIGAPVFDETGNLAGLLNADDWESSGVALPDGERPGFCALVTDKAYLYPMSHAMDMVAHFTAGLASGRQMDELTSRLDRTERKLEILSRISEEGLRNTFIGAASTGNVAEQRRIITTLLHISPGLTKSTIEAIQAQIQNGAVDEIVLRESAVVLYRNDEDAAASVIRSVLEKIPGYLTSAGSVREWMSAISEMRYDWIHQAVWFWLTGDDLPQSVKRYIVEEYTGLRCDEQVMTYFRERLSQNLNSLDAPLVEDIEYNLERRSARSPACDRTGGLS